MPFLPVHSDWGCIYGAGRDISNFQTNNSEGKNWFFKIVQITINAVSNLASNAGSSTISSDSSTSATMTGSPTMIPGTGEWRTATLFAGRTVKSPTEVGRPTVMLLIRATVRKSYSR